MHFKPGCFGALALAAVLSSACAAENDVQQPLRIGPHTFQVEVAATPQQREHGLMGRTRLPENGGMLFVFDYSGRHCFWMRNTPLPLSIAFIDDAGRIVNLADMQPHTDTLHCPASAIRYALEVPQGGFQQRNIGSGAQVNGLPHNSPHRTHGANFNHGAMDRIFSSTSLFLSSLRSTRTGR